MYQRSLAGFPLANRPPSPQDAPMPLLWKREKEVRDRLQEYFACADEAVKEFEAGMACYLEKGPCQEFVEVDRRIHAAESRADDLRIDIEKSLYRRMLLPESRGDLLGLLEAFDRMPNVAEDVTSMIRTMHIELPEQWRGSFGEMVDKNVEAYHQVRKGVDALFSDPDSVEKTVAPVDKLESASDKLEMGLISEVFASDLDKADMLVLRELINRLGDISDAAERVSHRLEIVSFKRRI